jgi:hypothetical protein
VDLLRQAKDPTYAKAFDLIESGWEPTPGKMYEVNINAKPEQFLDWDRPLAGQNELVQKTYNEVRDRRGGMPSDVRTGGQIYDLVGDAFTRSGHGMKKQYSVNAADHFRDAGIPGIRYLDQGSRGQGAGTSNYVLFRDDIIDILRKYGIMAQRQ